MTKATPVGTRRKNPDTGAEEVLAVVDIKGRNGNIRKEKRWVRYEKGKGLKVLATLAPKPDTPDAPRKKRRGSYIIDG